MTLTLCFLSALRHTADGGTMRTIVALLLLCLCDPGRSDCQTDCLSCSKILPKQLSFNAVVIQTHAQTLTHTHTQFQSQSLGVIILKALFKVQEASVNIMKAAFIMLKFSTFYL